MDTGDLKNNKFSKHAMKRAQQRGVKDQTVDIIIEFADKRVPSKDNCVSLSVSKKRLKSLVSESKLDAQTAEKMTDMVVVVAKEGDELTVVTVLHAEDGAKGRPYRKNVKPRRKRKKR